MKPTDTETRMREVFRTVAADYSDDPRLTRSSPAKKAIRTSDTAAEYERGVTFSTISLEDELKRLLKKLRLAAIEIQGGVKSGPIQIGWASHDIFERLTAGVSSAYRLSWGVSSAMTEAIREASGGGGTGLILFWGDPSPPHEGCIGWLAGKVMRQLPKYLILETRASTTPLAVVSGTRRAQTSTTALKEPDTSFLDSKRSLNTVIEVAWMNESERTLAQEIHKWAQTGRNAIGLKLWWSGDTSDQSTWSTASSILVLVQAKHSEQLHIWRAGLKAERAVIHPPSRTAPAPLEIHGPAVVLQGDWFCGGIMTPDVHNVPPPPVVWSLSELQLQVASLVADAEARADGGEQMAQHQGTRNFLLEYIAGAQAELRDLEVVDGISTERRDQLLSLTRARLAALQLQLADVPTQISEVP